MIIEVEGATLANLPKESSTGGFRMVTQLVFNLVVHKGFTPVDRREPLSSTDVSRTAVQCVAW